MKVREYKERLEVVSLLMKKGILKGEAEQIERGDLSYASGIDVVYNLKGLTPAKFKEYAEALLWLAYEETRRYEEAPIKFAKFVVQLNKTAKGRKVLTQPLREFTARGRPEGNILVYGEKELGYELTPDMHPWTTTKPFLVNKVEEILSMTEGYMKDLVQKQRPYQVLQLVISFREKKLK